MAILQHRFHGELKFLLRLRSLLRFLQIVEYDGFESVNCYDDHVGLGMKRFLLDRVNGNCTIAQISTSHYAVLPRIFRSIQQTGYRRIMSFKCELKSSQMIILLLTDNIISCMKHEIVFCDEISGLQNRVTGA